MITINNTIPGLIKNIEVKGNTYQDPNNLTKIISSGIDNGDGTYKMSILSCGENLDNSTLEVGIISSSTGENASASDYLRTKEFVRCNSDTQMYFSNTGKGVDLIFFYDKDKKFIGKTNVGQRSFMTPSNCYYIRYRFVANLVDMVSNRKLQEGTVATPYTPYEETRCDIKLPCQLEKVGDIADRLYFDKEENAWCIDKKNVSDSFDGSENWKQDATNELYTSFLLTGTKFKRALSLLNNYSSYVSNPNFQLMNCVMIGGNDGDLLVMIDKSFLGDDFSVNGFKNKLKTKNLIVKGIAFTSEKIVLPQSEQIKLNSFANKTHIYTISGEVNATVKATVSKSLASTVQANTNEINILSSKIADIEGLKETQDFSYETDKGYLVCKGTQTGVVKDLKIYGKSLNNLENKNNLGIGSASASNNYCVDTGTTKGCSARVEVGKEYTIIRFSNSNRFQICGFENTPENNMNILTIKEYSIGGDATNRHNIVKIKIDSSNVNYIQCYLSNTGENVNCLILEGDHTQNPPQYFEGIASVGNGNEIEVLSNNENYFNFNNFYYKKDSISYEIEDSNTIKVSKINGSSYDYVGFRLKLIPNKKYSIGANLTMSDNCGIGIKDVNGTGLVGDVTMITNKRDFVVPTDGIVEIRFYPTLGTTGNATMVANNIFIKSFENTNNFVKTKQDKKPILFKDTDNTWKPVTELRGIDLNSCDTIENGKLKNRIKKTLLNGVENYVSDAVVNQVKTIAFALNITDRKVDVNRDNIISDKFKTLGVNFTSDEEGIFGYGGGSGFVIRINRDRLETQDIQGFKKWLQLNNVTIIYELSQEIVYEVNPLDLESYDNETMILFGSGVIAPYASWKITSHAANIIKNQGQRLTRLENDFYKYTVIQNRIMLDSRYAADNATFKIDTSIYSSNNVTASNLHASICEVKETHQDIKYDFDLYKLIKRNILVGKDNYDRAWMEECITFYWMDFKISDQMHAELNEIIENQYNPPVDMTPIEPPMEDVVEEIPQA